MPEQMQQIKRRIRSVSSTEKITGAMKLVASARLKQATQRFNYVRAEIIPLRDRFKALVSRRGFPDEEASAQGQMPQPLLIMITSDKGMCGSYNATIIKEGAAYMASRPQALVLCIGAKGREYSNNHGLPQYNPGLAGFDLKEGLEYPQIKDLAEGITGDILQGRISHVDIIYARYKNSIAYIVETERVFPLCKEEGELSSDMTEYGSSDPEFFVKIAREYLALSIYVALCEGEVSEQGARRLAMNNANDNAKEMLESLNTRYHRARQQSITEEMIEIISGAESQQLNQKAGKDN